MSLTTGVRLGPYEIAGPLGEGGMGAVYRATDTRLNRSVAIKAMHASGALDPDHVARFEREAQLLASLNHPNIAAIHGLETVEATTYLVLEFVDGRPLSEVLRDGPLPLNEALPIARQIADALAATHERGIIHRDLKPGNVMVTPDGQVKVLDFGLGKTLDGGTAPTDSANSPTMTLAATQAGIILGTAGYMSPEQAKGRTADKRSDVWAFGCVLFEMLSGRRAFEGEDITETLAAIVRGEPDWAALPAATPPAIRALIERCLIRSRADRLPDMSVVKFVLSEPGTLTAQAAAPAMAPRGVSLPIVAAVAAIALAAGAGGMGLWSSSAAPAGREPAAVTIALPDEDMILDTRRRPVAMSRDGRHIAYVAARDGPVRLFVRSLSDPTPRMLVGTEGASDPFFSFSGEWLGFFAQGQLKKISVDGAGLMAIADAPTERGGTWSADDRIYFAPTQVSGLLSVPASGGAPAPVTTLDAAAGEVSHRWPFILPDGKTLLFTSWIGPGPDERRVAAATVGAAGPVSHVVLLAGGDTPQYVDGHLLYAKGGNLFSVAWRPGQTDVGRAVPAAENVHPREQSEVGLYAVSDAGTVIYVPGDRDWRGDRAVWVDREGRTTALPLPLDNYMNLFMAPDGRRMVVQILKGAETLWMYDLGRNTLQPLTPANASSQSPVWTSDSQFIIYRGTRNGTRNLYRRRADGTGEEERLTTAAGVMHTPTSASRDGEWVAFSEVGGNGAGDILALRLTGDHAIRPLVNSAAHEQNGQISPDGRWVAYQSDASGRVEIYVQPFPGPGPATPVSTDGGIEPLWSRDGRELYYVPPSADRLMVVAVPPGASWTAGRPRVLYEGTYKPNQNGNTPYDVTADGRFLRVQSLSKDGAISRIEVILNWTPIGK